MTRDWSPVIDRVPCLRGRSVVVQELSGGLTNVNLRVTSTDGTVDVVVRVAQPGSELLAIDRAAEHHNSVAAAAAGVGAPVLDYLPDPGLLVVGFLPGRTWTEADLHDEAQLPRVAAACRRLHAGPRFVGDFDMVAIQRRYLDLVLEHGFRLPEGYLDLMPCLERAARALAASPVATVPCHNDLLAGNFVDDGERLWLIDYEYSGNNDPCFELGNIASEAGLDAQQTALLVASYDGRADPTHADRARLARALLWGLLAQYGWTLWGSIQQSVSTIDFDFWGWSMAKYDVAAAGLRGPGFDRLLDEVGRG